MIERLNAALEGRYLIERDLGEGGMATVYLADDLRHHRKVALKVLKPELAAVIGAERFLTEIRTTANLQHPHILPLHDSGTVEGTVFYVMPYVEGESVRDRLERETQLPVADAVRIATEVADALDYAHRQGIVHRDVKPENILLHDGRALVADFGIALAASRSDGDRRLTETGMSLGTPHYMSPEQATGERDLDGRADVYALGCVLYEMLVGEPPFTAPSAQAVVAKLITAEPTPVQEFRKTVPRHVAAATWVALQKLPADRFATAAEMASALKDPSWTSGPHAAGARAASGAATSPGARRPLPGLLPWGIAVAGMGVAALIALRPSPPAAADHATRFTLGLPNADGVRAVVGRYGHVAVSPDGSEVVFLGTQSGQNRLFRRSLGGLGVEPLPGTGDAVYPTFSPAGTEIAFATPEGVYRLPLDGGRPRPVATPPDIPLGIAWAPDETLLFGMLAYNGDYRGLSRLSLQGEGAGDLTKLTEPEAMHHWAHVLEGGTHALFTDYGVSGGGLSLIDLADGSFEPVELSVAPRWVVGVAGDALLYLDRDGRLMAAGWDPDRRRVLGPAVPVPGVPDGLGNAALSRSGTLVMTAGAAAYQLAVVDPDGEVERLVASDSLGWATPRFSPDGERLLLGAALRGGDHETWIVDLASGVPSQLSMGFQPSVTEWSADGREVLATSQRQFAEPQRGLWSRPADASGEARHVIPAFGWAGAEEDPGERDFMTAHAVSAHPDGVTLALTVDVGTNPAQRRWDVYIGRMDGDTTLVPFATGEADEVAARFSPDGRWLAYASNESGRFQVYVRPFPGPGARLLVSAEGGGQPVWSASGDRIFYRTDDALMAAELSLVDGALQVEGRERLFQGTLFGGPGETDAYYDVHPEGDRFVVLRGLGERAGDVVVWTNWLDELRPLPETGR